MYRIHINVGLARYSTCMVYLHLLCLKLTVNIMIDGIFNKSN